MEIRGSVPPGPERAGPGRPATTEELATTATDEPATTLPYEGVWRFTVPAVEASVPEVRHALRDLLVRQGVPAPEDLVQGLLLITSELVTNAVKHAAVLSPRVAVELRVGAGRVRIAVQDNHPYKPAALEADQDRPGGRGLLLVKALTAEAGGVCDVERTDKGGKVVWAELPFSRPAAG